MASIQLDRELQLCGLEIDYVAPDWMLAAKLPLAESPCAQPSPDPRFRTCGLPPHATREATKTFARMCHDSEDTSVNGRCAVRKPATLLILPNPSIEHLLPSKSTRGEGARFKSMALPHERATTKLRDYVTAHFTTTSPTSAFSPTLLWGRRWRSRMRGRLPLATTVPISALLSRAAITSCPSIARHPSSAFGTFSPRKARGEKALDVSAWRRFRWRVRT